MTTLTKMTETRRARRDEKKIKNRQRKNKARARKAERRGVV